MIVCLVITVDIIRHILFTCCPAVCSGHAKQHDGFFILI